MTEPTAQQAAERIEAALRESTPGRWCKGQTTHHTVAKFTDGKKPYAIGEFHHAVDAEFAERCHELLPILLAERRELLARQVPDEPLVWRATTHCYFPYVSERQYNKFSPAVRKWYEPVCQTCAAKPPAATD